MGMIIFTEERPFEPLAAHDLCERRDLGRAPRAWSTADRAEAARWFEDMTTSVSAWGGPLRHSRILRSPCEALSLPTAPDVPPIAYPCWPL